MSSRSLPVTASDARMLDRAIALLQRQKISHGRWVETLDAWVRGEDVSRWDYGAVEPLNERALHRFRGETVTLAEVCEAFDVSSSGACHALERLCRVGLAERIEIGRYRIGPAPSKAAAAAQEEA